MMEMIRRIGAGTVAPVLICVLAAAQQPEIPRTWDRMDDFELPLADRSVKRVHISADYYYSLRERVIYKSYPVYAPGREPAGYHEGLERTEPEIAFDATSLRTDEDWIRAGALVFDAPIEYGNLFTIEQFRDAALVAKVGVPVAADGTIPFARYVVRRRGVVELGNLACGMCHTRVMPDGAVIKGAQGNFPFDPIFAETFYRNEPMAAVYGVNRTLVAAPWIQTDPQAGLDRMTREEVIAAFAAVPAGVLIRQGTSILFPPQIPDLIGVKDRRYLDNTGLNRHRSIGDLMRYAALNQTLDTLTRYNDFLPAANDFTTLPEPGKSGFAGGNDRNSEEQLFALARFLYSLAPPQNPNQFDATAQRGQQVFQRAGCATCHTPPLYTNNKLTPAAGFDAPPDDLSRDDVLSVRVGTDPTLTLTTRRGTGYYKVPSLKGVWYRGPFEHNGSVATLEDWFDSRRLRDDYVPTGFIGHNRKTRAVKGHEFGLALAAEDKRALIAFLRTL
jgi:hypothetical protein